MKDNQTSEKCVCGRELDHEIKDSLDAGCKTHYVDQTSECPNADEHNNPAFPSTCSLCEETKTSEGKNKCYIFVKRFNDGINVKISTKEFQQEAFVTNQMLDFSIDETAMLDFSAFNSMVISQAKEEEQDKRVCIICGEKVVDCHGHILKNESQPKETQTSEKWEEREIFDEAVTTTQVQPRLLREDKVIKIFDKEISQAKEEERERIIKEYGSFDDGCGCCALTTLKEELSKLNSHD